MNFVCVMIYTHAVRTLKRQKLSQLLFKKVHHWTLLTHGL